MIKTQPKLSRLAAFVVNTEKWYNTYSKLKEDFVSVIWKTVIYDDLSSKWKEIILDCLKGSGRTLDNFN